MIQEIENCAKERIELKSESLGETLSKCLETNKLLMNKKMHNELMNDSNESSIEEYFSDIDESDVF